MSTFKVGDRVRTASGMFGTIVERQDITGGDNRVHENWLVLRDGDEHTVGHLANNNSMIPEEIWNSPLAKAMREE